MPIDLNRRDFLFTSTKAALLAYASVHIVGCEDEKYEITEDEEGNLIVRDVAEAQRPIQFEEGVRHRAVLLVHVDRDIELGMAADIGVGGHLDVITAAARRL